MRIRILKILFLVFFIQNALAQEREQSPLSGSLQVNGNFYLRDSAIGAANIPQYDRQLVGTDAWLTLNYNKAGFDIGVRLDVFNNSQLLNPKESYTAGGIGRFYVKKQIGNLSIYGGYIYDQIGTGIIFRSYEDRPLGIDNALVGVNLDYQISDNVHIKGFSGRQKRQFELYKSTVNGLNAEAFYTFGKISMASGTGIVHRTLDDETVNQVVNAIATYSKADSIGAKYNTFSFTAYNTLSAGKWTWYLEAAYKTPEVIFDPFAVKINRDGSLTEGKFVQRAGTVFYSNLSFATEGVGVTLEGKRTEGFTFRTTPFAVLNRGILNFLPPMSRQNSYRLTTRYVPATQELGEQAVQLDVKYAPSDDINIDVNTAHIFNLNNKILYREIYASVLIKKEKYQWTLGVQRQEYNQEIYEVKPKVALVKTITPFVEFLIKKSDTKAWRFETQYMATRQDYGAWVWLLAEYSIAPKWIFTVSDMWNIEPKKTAKALHYPTLAAAFTKGSNRFSLSFVKQVEGVVCTGGICRLEPAFSGLRLSITSSF